MKVMLRGLNTAAAALLAMGLAPCQATSAGKFAELVVLGDSLSDNGNAGRFSNGPVWVEQLATRLGLMLRPSQAGGSNFAVGGARLDAESGPTSLRAQADAYLKRPRRAGRTLHIVFGGGNDLLAAVEAPDGESMVDVAAASLKSIVADLAERGATDVLVANLPDVGITPAVMRRGEQAVDRARVLTKRFNAAADEALGELGRSSTMRIHRLDVASMAAQAREDPGAFGFVDVTTPCAALASCEGYLFWDDVHPTTSAHARLAEAAAETVLER
jgi:phospholipase/lecithinase/hemolysin